MQLLEKFRDHEDEMSLSEAKELQAILQRQTDNTNDLLLIFAGAILNYHIMKFMKDHKGNKPLSKFLGLFPR